MAQGVRVLDEARANTLLPTIADAIRTVGAEPAALGADPGPGPDPDPDPDPALTLSTDYSP
eukprot:scaffold3315_cov62-Phaeocystis_antarctica.AAC.6